VDKNGEIPWSCLAPGGARKAKIWQLEEYECTCPNIMLPLIVVSNRLSYVHSYYTSFGRRRSGGSFIFAPARGLPGSAWAIGFGPRPSGGCGGKKIGFDGALGSLAQEVLELGEDLFNRIEV
jgi:hypothetical protein